MRTIYFLLQKEFLQIFRDNGMLVVILLMPLIQLVVLAYAATFELNDTPFYLVDFDQSTTSRQLVNDFEATGYFSLVDYSQDIDKGINQILSNEAQMVMVIPSNFEKDIRSGQPANVQLIINAVNGSTSGLIQSYSQAILLQFNEGLSPTFQTVRDNASHQQIRIVASSWYNRTLDYTHYMVPGILILLITLICLVLSVLNIVREQEIGTIE